MDDHELDGWLLALAMAGLAAAVLMLCNVVKSLQQDVALLRITAAVPEVERDT